jgi:hypothetical protein
VAKIKYDVSDVEPGGDFKQPKPGLYNAKIDECESGKSKAGNDQLRVVIKITDKGEFKGSNLFHYVPTDPNSPGFFRMEEFTRALGLRKKGTLDTDKIVGTPVQVRVKADSYEGEYRARVGSVLKAKGDAEDDDAEDLDDEDGTDDEDLDDDEPGNASDDDGDDDAAEGDDDASDDEDGDDYDEWSADELKAELKERGLRVAGKRAVLIGRLRKDDESDDDDPFS